jgi:hypothetical protein
MRNRKEILADAQKYDWMHKEILEVLLDIRELLMKKGEK